MKKRYIVMIQDIWNNLYFLGEYSNLNDAVPDVNEWLSGVTEKRIEELKEYPSTFGMAFDCDINMLYEDDDDCEESYMVRGFILEDE